MKITLDIDPAALSTEVSDFIQTLTVEDKQNMVKQVVEQYYADFRKFEDNEFATKEKEIIEGIRKGANSWNKDQYATDDGVRQSSEYEKAKRSFKTYSQTTREEISSSIRLQLTKNISEFVINDETYKKLLQESMDSVKERFPLMVQAAMIAHFTNQLPNIASVINEQLGNVYGRLTQVEQKLLR